jgi:hypothetical protein
MSSGLAVLAWIGLALGAGALGLALSLLHRVLRPLLEINRYADATLEAGLGIARNLDGASELARTRELATAVPGLATDFLGRKA